MEPVFVDLHIHTSENPNKLNSEYPLDLLKANIEKESLGSPYLISLTDHNTINKPVYLAAVDKFKYLLLGVELHVRNYDDQKPYHCHIYFRLDSIDESSIDDLNLILDRLYPQKEVSADDARIPRLEAIMKAFDNYEFLLLPHGGQSHSAFHESIPDGTHFDSTLERSIYYNHFDGFTARSHKGLERTLEYFERLGIREFVNLVTSSDNYYPEKYPNAKAKEAPSFVPTWMLATPTFSGLRISLSESSRLHYGGKPDAWAECIRGARLVNDNININISFTPGLNVVIGGSSSGKSLLVDSLYRKVSGNFEGSEYLKSPYNVQDIEIDNPAGQIPHYLPQSYIVQICDKKDKESSIDDIDILRRVFPDDKDEREEIANGLAELGKHLSAMMQAVEGIEMLQKELSKIPKLSHLIVAEIVQGNPLKLLKPSDRVIDLIEYGKAQFRKDEKALKDIDAFLSANPLITHDKNLITKLVSELELAFKYSQLEIAIRSALEVHIKEIDDAQETENLEMATKRQQFEDLLECISRYMKLQEKFYNSIKAIARFSIKVSTKEIVSMGHKLFIDNEFELTQEKFVEVLNEMLKREFAIKTIDHILPESLFEQRFSKQKPKVQGYKDFIAKMQARFSSMNKKKFRILTKEGRDFDVLSAGWKTSVILDLILGWHGDNAPLIIDQPEDNLATGYINGGLLRAIKECKAKKQIILVSHSATIPMLGDAQNVIMCRNNDKIITIKSNPLEGRIDDKDIVDLIAETTDGGKISVKKRVKKYNLKNFRSPNETFIQKK
jgi:predicted ATP-dependent endonuclease of OLD family